MGKKHHIFNKTEKDERQYLERIKLKLQDTIGRIDRSVENYSRELQQQKDYLWENKAGMDHVEKVAVRQSVTQAALTGEAAVEKKKRLQKLMDSPWFGRIDFKEKNEDEALPVYIGVHSYYDEEAKENIIYDWRAPVSAMYYDFEKGSAAWDAPGGRVEGEISLKRQYRIRGGRMEYMIDTSLTIHDEILQQELGRASGDRMKHIVATIQRDQNAVIRNIDSHVLIIQGVAGSGKTSIALHRIAFLLYRFRESISSKDILILSPNKVFADYISNVLPELGEEKIPEMGMEELAGRLLENKYRFRTFFDQVAAMLEKKDDAFRERVRFKSSFSILNRLNEYVTYVENNYFRAELIRVNKHPVPASYIEEKYQGLHRLPVLERLNEIAVHIERDLLFYNSYEISGTERNELRRSLRKMFRITNLRDLYKDFYRWMGKPELLKYSGASIYEYPDVFPLVYLKIKLEGIKPFNNVKHLLVDEMQDYTPVQYAVLASLFPCKKTILGDIAQSVNPLNSSDAATIARVFPLADSVNINKSYRSTREITLFAHKIRPDINIEVIERHGGQPLVKGFKNREEEIRAIKESLFEFQDSGHKSLGLICKTARQAAKLYEELKNDFPRAMLLTADSTAYSQGIIITGIHMSKGLEFDHVIVPGTDKRNYIDEAHRSLLYIACTRAMHRLEVFYVKEVSGFIDITWPG
ncbi:MAG: AAA family ATPase [Bacteroidales bacterium]|nr:AAA family ATPase [Bacteroidales bacterium]